MPFDITPVHKTGTIRPQVPHPEAAPERRTHPAQVSRDAGVTVEADPGLSAATPPFDVERVNEIRKALEDGTYPVLPTRIADAMIAARYLLSTTT